MHPTLSKSGYVLLLSLSILLLCSSVWAVQLSWQAPTTLSDGITPATAAGFYLYYRQAGQTTNERMDVGFRTTHTLEGLTVGQTYYFTVTAYDTSRRESAPSNEASITISNSTTARAPVANHDTVSTPEDTSVTTGNVLANDTDANGDALSIASFTQPTRGSVVRNGTTAFTYTPQANFSGTDTFTYTIRDPGGLTATGTVTVTVTAVNDRPVAQADSATTTAGTAVTIAVLANDSDVDNDPLTVSATTSASRGTVTRNGNTVGNTVTYTPDAGFTGTDNFSYTVSDSRGGTATGTVTITVTATAVPGLVAAYNFDEGSGTTLTDRSGNGRTGTIAGATWTNSGKYGSALSFDGNNDWVTIPDAPALDLTTAMTLAAWVYPTATPTTWSTVLMKEQPGNLVYVLYAGSASNRPSVRVNVSTSSSGQRSTSGPAALPLNTWSHLAGTYNGSTLRLYVNGALVSSQNTTGAIITSSGALRIGGNSIWGRYFQGRIDEVRIYNRALAQSDIQTAMNTPVGGTLPPDTTAPTVAITTPTSGATYTTTTSSLALGGTATDNVAVTQVSWTNSRGGSGTATGTTPWSVSGIGLQLGTNVLTITARDAAGNTGTDTLTVTYTTPDTSPPTVRMTTPGAGATVSGTTTVTATASDNIGVVGVQFLLDGAPLGAEQTGPLSLAWNTTLVSNGAHTLAARARDAAGNTTTAASVAVTVANAQSSGLVAAYGFNETSGTTVTDASGRNNTGTLGSGVTRTTQGRFGSALVFNGASFVTIPATTSLNLTTGMTLSAWVYPTALSGWRTVILRERSGGLVHALYAHDNAPRPAAYVNAGGADMAAPGTASPPLNAWTHLAATYDGSTLRLYVNGSQVGSKSVGGAMVTSSQPLRIGGNAVWGEYFTGRIDEVRIYNRTLSASEIQTSMTTPVSPPPAASQASALIAGARNATGQQKTSARVSGPMKNRLPSPLTGGRTPDDTATTGDSITVMPPDNTARLFEFGEVQVDSTWHTVTFRQTFIDPIVVARPSSNDNRAPAPVRLRDVTPTGFALRLQGEDALDGAHGPETVSYLVVERGRHTLEGNVHIEAGSREVSQTNSLVTVPFRQAFAVAPVVLTAVSSPHETTAVSARVRNVTTSNFQVRMQKQHKNTHSQAQETMTYIAWSPSAGTLTGDLVFEVQTTPDAMAQRWKTLRFTESFTAIPVLLTDLQTTHGSAPESLLWENKDFFGVDVKVAEEPSTTRTMEQTTAVIGYMAFAFQDSTTDSDGDGLTNADEILRYGTDPAVADTDQDGLDDGEEVQFWGMLWNADPDGDGLINLLDLDSDNDGILDGAKQ